MPTTAVTIENLRDLAYVTYAVGANAKGAIVLTDGDVHAIVLADALRMLAGTDGIPELAGVVTNHLTDIPTPQPGQVVLVTEHGYPGAGLVLPPGTQAVSLRHLSDDPELRAKVESSEHVPVVLRAAVTLFDQFAHATVPAVA